MGPAQSSDLDGDNRVDDAHKTNSNLLEDSQPNGSSHEQPITPPNQSPVLNADLLSLTQAMNSCPASSKVPESTKYLSKVSPIRAGQPGAPPSIDEVDPGLFIGDLNCISEPFLREMGITTVITVLSHPIPDHHNSALRVTIPLKHRLFLNAEDDHFQDMLQYFPTACDFIDKRLRPHLFTNNNNADALDRDQDKSILPKDTESNEKKKHKVLVHCRMGISRSACIAAAYIMYKNGQDFETTWEALRRSRPKVHPNSTFRRQLQVWYNVRFKLYSKYIFMKWCPEYLDVKDELRSKRLKEEERLRAQQESSR
ncbi:unnamed protein product [Discula destructiva]